MAFEVEIFADKEEIVIKGKGSLIQGVEVGFFLTSIKALLILEGTRVIFSMEETSYFDSCGAGAIVAAWEHVKKQGGTFAIRGLSKRGRGFFKLTKFDTFLEIVDDNQATQPTLCQTVHG